MKAAIQNQFDAENAAALCGLAAGTYSFGRDALPRAPGCAAAQTYQLIEDDETDTRAVVCDGVEDVVVAFRGTADLRNWLTDLDARFKADFCCRVHAGFSAALDGVQGRLLEAISDTPKRVWLTGHSLGGALAMLFAWRIANLKSEILDSVAGIYTFGQPRVGDGGFRDCYDALLKERTFRVVDGEDFITRIPWLLGAYRHCGHEVFYGEDASPTRPDGSASRPYQLDCPGWVYAAREVNAMLSFWLRPTSAEQWLADHHVSKYQGLFEYQPGESFPGWNPKSSDGSTESRPTVNEIETAQR